MKMLILWRINQHLYLMVIKVLAKEGPGVWSCYLDIFQNYSTHSLLPSKNNLKNAFSFFYTLSQFPKQAATPSAAAEQVYRVELHGLHANTIVWAAQLLLKDRLDLHIKRILQNMPIWGVHKEQSFLQLLPCLLKVLMHIADIKHIPQSYLVIYWELFYIKCHLTYSFLAWKGGRKMCSKTLRKIK